MLMTPPSFRLPKSVFFVVSSIISKLHFEFEIPVTVRHTPFNATLWPILSPLACLPRSTVIFTALLLLVFFSILIIFPMPSMIPVNNSCYGVIWI